MSRRRLTTQQEDRIRRRQKQAVNQRHGPCESSDTITVDGPRWAGIVTCNFGQQLEVEALEGPQRRNLVRCFQRSNLPPLVCGDRVIFTADQEDGGVILGLEERRNEFARPGAGGQLKPVAANIDLVMVVLAPRPQPFLNLLDRYLVAIENLQLKPLIVINKTDLLNDKAVPAIDAVLADYPGLGYPVVDVSALQGEGLETLKATLNGTTAVMVGQSGVGKSSLINSLSPAVLTRTGPLSGSGDKGIHTTTAARLFHLDGFDLIDSPGIREFSLWHMSPEKVLEGFVEFRPFSGHCRFRDCSHRTEPDCALRQAVEQGVLKAYRLESYFQILDSP